MDIITTDGSTQPAFVSVETAARYLGISRGTGYALANKYLETGEGVRCMRLGARLLVPVNWLLEVSGRAGSGPDEHAARSTAPTPRRRSSTVRRLPSGRVGA